MHSLRSSLRHFTARVMKPSLALLTVAALSVTLGCRGQLSDKPPVWGWKHGMENQGRFNAFEKNDFYSDGRNMRHPPAGTVARGLLKEDDAFWRGGTDTVEVARIPFQVTAAVMERGEERYKIYCTPCHGQTGIGNGIVVQKGYLPPPNLGDPRLLTVTDGYLYRAISFGIRNMPAYGKQIPEADRWAIVAYVRALQRSMNSSEQDVPESQRGNLR